MDNKYNGKKAVIYARYSCHSQTEQSIEGQLRDIYEFAKRNGIIIVGEYIDRAISGTKDDRPDFLRMIRDSEKRQFTLVLVWKLDRFARDRYMAATYRQKLRKNGVSLVSVMENISDNPEGTILESVLEGMAEYYSKDLSVKIKRGQRICIEKGWFPGGNIPYGYINQDHKLVPDPRTAPIVKEIFDRYVHGEKMSSIINDLNQRGVLFKHGRPFQMSSITRVLTDPAYIGNFRFAGQTVEGCSTPIIDKDIFNRVIIQRESNRRAPAADRKPGVHYWLLGKLFCGECGNRFAGDGCVSRSGKYHYYYTCSTKKHDRHECNSKTVRKLEIEYVICKSVADFILTNNSGKAIEILADTVMNEYEDREDVMELRELEVQVKRINGDVEKLIDSLIDMPDVAKGRVGQRIEALENQRRDLDVRIAKKRIECNLGGFDRDDFRDFFKLTVTDLENEACRKFIIDKFLNAAYLYNDGRLVIYLNHFNGINHLYGDENLPGPDGYKKGKMLFKNKIPKEIRGLPDFRKGSTLLSYAPHDADKVEPRLPHLFFLHGRIGFVTWLTDLRK